LRNTIHYFVNSISQALVDGRNYQGTAILGILCEGIDEKPQEVGFGGVLMIEDQKNENSSILRNF